MNDNHNNMAAVNCPQLESFVQPFGIEIKAPPKGVTEVRSGFLGCEIRINLERALRAGSATVYRSLIERKCFVETCGEIVDDLVRSYEIVAGMRNNNERNGDAFNVGNCGGR